MVFDQPVTTVTFPLYIFIANLYPLLPPAPSSLLRKQHT